MNRRWGSSIKLHWKAAALTAIVAVLAAGFGYRRWSADFVAAQAELDAELRAIERRGEPVRFSDCEPSLLAAQENAALLFVLARSQLVGNSPEWRELMDLGGRQPAPGDYQAFRDALSANEKALATLRRALSKPRCYFPYHYRTDQPFSILLRDVQATHAFSRLLQADVAQSLGTGDSRRAISAVDEHLNLARLLEDEPFLVSRMVLHVITRRAMNSLQDVLGHTELDPEQFDALDRCLARLQETATLKELVLKERAITLSTMETVGSPMFRDDVLDLEPARRGVRPPPSTNALDRIGRQINNEVKNRGWASELYRPRLMRNQVFVLRTLSEFAEIVDQPGPEGAAAFARMNADLKEQVRDYPVAALFVGEPQQVMDLEWVRLHGLWHRQRLTIARLALRVARYRTLHGRLPEMLAEVADQDIPEIPSDLFTGAALVYQPRQNGFLIFALNEQGEDDGGIRPADEVNLGARFEVMFAGSERGAAQ